MRKLSFMVLLLHLSFCIGLLAGNCENFRGNSCDILRKRRCENEGVLYRDK